MLYLASQSPRYSQLPGQIGVSEGGITGEARYRITREDVENSA